MKKHLFGVALMSLAMVSLVACKDDKKDEPKGGNEGGNTVVDEAPVTIDGNFADWNEAADVAVATLGDDAAPNLSTFKTLKAVTDADYIYIYMEYDPAEVYAIDIFFDTDNNIETGTESYLFPGAGMDYLVESFKTDEAENLLPMGNFAETASIFKYAGDGTTWAWDDLGAAGAVESCMPVELSNGNKAIEISVVRAMVSGGADFAADNMRIGVFTSASNWGESGALPTVGVDAEGNTAATGALTVKLN